jgi:hypothetical protein
MTTKDWGTAPILDRNTPFESLEIIITQQADIVRAKTRAALSSMPDHALNYLMRRLEPRIQATTRATILAGWERLQIEKNGVQ